MPDAKVKKNRLDLILVERKLIDSRSLAQRQILAGEVIVNNEKITKPGTLVNINSKINIKSKPKYVSRAGLKLEKAINFFEINISKLICLDIGSSTGGFTDCLLKMGAEKVYAIDVGTNQLVWELRTNPKVTVYEKTNFRYVTPEIFLEKINLVVADLSFISLTKVIHKMDEITSEGTKFLLLIKPQFEAKREEVKNGVVRSEKIHFRIIESIINFAHANNLNVVDLTYSPILGAKKANIEYIAYFVKTYKNDKIICDKSKIFDVITEAKKRLNKNN